MSLASRRAVLKALGWTAAGLAVVATGGCALLPALPYRGDPTAEDAAAWLRLTPDGLIELVSPRAEMGQGVAVALRQIVAEETGFPLDRIVAVPPRTDRLPPARATVGSDSIKDFGPLLAQAAAALAAVLAREGVTDGAPPAGGWAAIAGRPRLLEADAIEAAAPRSFGPREGLRVVGTSPPTDGARAIVTGEAAIFADDVRLPGLVFGARLAPDRLGARLAGLDDAAARAVPGYLGSIEADGRALLAAETRGALERARAALRPRWEGGWTGSDDMLALVDVDAGLARGRLEHALADGEVALDEPFDVDLRLDVGLAAHGAIEPRTAVARFDGDRLEVWTGTQDATFARQALARAMGLSDGDVTVIGRRVGGGFGARTILAAELDAARLARAFGRPVKAQWTREDEFRSGFHRPPSSHRVRARLAPDGRIAAFHHAFRSGHVIFTSAAMGPTLQFATSFVADPGVGRGAVPPYAAERLRVEFDDVRLPVDTGPWRGLGAAQNVWAIETAIDALARARAEDPVAFRLRTIAPERPRLARVLRRAAEMSGWAGRRSTPERGFGVACGVYKDMAYAAVVAEIVRAGKGWRAARIWCAHDCGRMINPGQVKAQVEGNLMWGVGMALVEELTLAGGQVEQASFADYAIPRFSDAPEMEIELIDDGNPATGAGETAIVAAAPAITNAIAAMTGRPVARLPARAA